jgi:hypothetical protein
MTKEQINEFLSQGWEDHEFLHADGFEDAFIGVVYGKCRNPVTCYDREACIAILMGRDGMTEEVAEEFFGFNVEDAWVGESTPMFLSRSGSEVPV